MRQITAGSLRIGWDSAGAVLSLYDVKHEREYLAPGRRAPLLSLASGDRVWAPDDALWDDAKSRLILRYGSAGLTATVAVAVKPTHVTFELLAVEGGSVSAALWGPYPTSIRETVGETVGVVQDAHFAIGIQALNIKTIGGWPEEYSDQSCPDGDAGEARFAYRACAAFPTAWGSVLQAYSRDRTEGRAAPVWDVSQAVVPAYTGPDASVVGSKIALFGCPADHALDVIGSIEQSEGLPHPMLDGEWVKKSPLATQSYLITRFSEANLDQLLEYAQRAGLRYVYHEGPFQTWGHFRLHPAQFPDGDESMQRCVAKAARAGIRLGVHTLSNFITPNDPYVTPIPDARLQEIGASVLEEDVDSETATIPVRDPHPFREQQRLSTVMIDGELIRYGGVSASPPWRLLDCERGAFGTHAAPHRAGAAVRKLWDHPYRVFFPNLAMQDELAARIVTLFNTTGLRQISFDGLEGCWATGHGDYAVNRFVQQCHAGWRHDVISDASLLNHFTWHVHTRANWGEPWGAAMREGMPEYRFNNQRYFERNLFPRMLGWFLMRLASSDFEATTLDDIEWVLSKAAGFGAGTALVAHPEVLSGHGMTAEILDLVREWETARLSGAFTAEQRLRLRDPRGEWHLTPTGERMWELREVAFSKRFVCDAAELQPGQPGGADWPYENRHGDQPLRFRLRVVPRSTAGAVVENPSFAVNRRAVTFPVRLEPGQYLICHGDAQGRVYDANWHLIRTVPAQGSASVAPGPQVVSFSCDFLSASDRPRVEVVFCTMGRPEAVVPGSSQARE